MRQTLRIIRGMLLIGALVSLSGCGGASTRTSSAHADYATLIGAGVHLLRGGNTSAAKQLFEQAVAKKPTVPVGQYDLGVVYGREGDVSEALRRYTLALAGDPNYAPALYNKAVILGAHSPLIAIFYYRKVISLAPKAATAFLNLGLLLSAHRATRAAGRRALSKAIELQPSLRARIPAPLRAQLSR